ncbi:hypothetical protein XF35_22550 [Streptomyces platensis subsp. clarensis]|nr:hypothetical protein [Streptomyces platensis subsp. clarensis]
MPGTWNAADVGASAATLAGIAGTKVARGHWPTTGPRVNLRRSKVTVGSGAGSRMRATDSPAVASEPSAAGRRHRRRAGTTHPAQAGVRTRRGRHHDDVR